MELETHRRVKQERKKRESGRRRKKVLKERRGSDRYNLQQQNATEMAADVGMIVHRGRAVVRTRSHGNENGCGNVWCACNASGRKNIKAVDFVNVALFALALSLSLLCCGSYRAQTRKFISVEGRCDCFRWSLVSLVTVGSAHDATVGLSVRLFLSLFSSFTLTLCVYRTV